ncbi:collagen-like triple helix repeat-containing protein [Agrobacterium tumefaciens]|uniref:Collagen-like protein n=1 Tax=Agrobacterium tumefaciens TaxID=358 RepID=A0AA44J9U3_AGRTU|nr:hypothetical protein [Agrobacterium tumefaciens]NTB87710.1 hypothetical protein [Agrobacterium tumefaciens]NTC17477.1 hypothetical protein [Agrobacterium tumefaciens]NTC29741.1 hypothetical protein [Agrobacterium tumefaciens]
MGLLEFLNLAYSKVPRQTGVALAGTVLFALAALVLGWIKDYGLGLTLAVVIAILILGVVGSAVATVAVKGAGKFLTWAISALFILVLTLCITSVFFGWPKNGAIFIARLTGAPIILSQITPSEPAISIASSRTVAIQDLVDSVRRPVKGTDETSRAEELSARPRLNVSGTLEMAAGESRTLALSTLNLNDGQIVTNGGDLLIEVNDLISDNGTIRSFPDPIKAATQGEGKSGGKVTIVVHNEITGRLNVQLLGQNGANGADGAKGGTGGKGASGDNSASGVVDCRRGPGRGRTGSSGLAGGTAQNGFKGGDGGILEIRAPSGVSVDDAIVSKLSPGRGGSPGKPGEGGDGGPGGDGGGSSGLCRGEGSTGETGPKGPEGQAGIAGPDGNPGQRIIKQIK